MRKAFVLLFVLLFAGIGEGAVLCLATPPATVGGSHGCCPDRAAPPGSIETCCGMSQPDRDAAPSNIQANGTAVALSIQPFTLFDHSDPGRSPLSCSSGDCGSGSVPLYLQHLSLLI